MRRFKNKQRWDNLNPGFQRNSRNANGYQNNWNQNHHDNYENPYLQGDMNNSYANNWCDMGQNYNNPRYLNDHYSNQNFQRNFIRNNNNFSNFGVGSAKKDFNSNRGKFNRNANNKFPKVQTNIPQYTKFDEHNVQDDINLKKNTTQKSCNLNLPKHIQQNFSNRRAPKSVNPWYVNPSINGVPKRYSRYHTRSRYSFVKSYDYDTKLYNDKGYITRESLYEDPSLFYDDNDSNNDLPILKNEPSSTEDWTDKYWQKHVNTGAPKISESPYTSVTVSNKTPNSVEKILNEMLAKPAEMDKGKNLLLKMGWQGGGLGRDSDGILEPITPNSAYAVNTIGLGLLAVKPEPEPKPQPEPKKILGFAQLTKKKLKKPEYQDKFYTNLLHYILEFVKNDAENKIIFEPRLMKMERMRIHLLVEQIRESDKWEDFESLEGIMDKHFDLVKDIWLHNYYELWSESEGESMERRICLYKEAPAHVYLITPEDLTEDDNQTDFDDTNEFDGDKSDCVKEEMYLDDENETYLDDEDDVDSDDSVDGKQEKYNIIDRERKYSNVKTNPENETQNANNHVESKQKTVDIKQRSVVKNDMEDMEVCEQKIFKKENNTSESATEYNICEMNDETQSATNYAGFKQSVDRNEPNMEVCERKIFKKDNNTSESAAENKISVKNIQNLKEVKAKMENTSLNVSFCDDIKYETEENVDVKQEKHSIMGKIVTYFKEFCAGEIFKEFRFLGPFSDEEIEDINLFFDICMELDNNEREENTEVAKLFQDNMLDLLEDNNGKRFIKKVG